MLGTVAPSGSSTGSFTPGVTLGPPDVVVDVPEEHPQSDIAAAWAPLLRTVDGQQEIRPPRALLTHPLI